MPLAVDPKTGLIPWHSYSLTAVLRCGEAYRRKYLEKEGRPPTTPQIRGSAVHRGVAVGLTAQQASGTVAPVDLYEDVAASEIERARHGGATLTEEEVSVGLPKTWGRLKDTVVRYAGTYGRVVAPGIRPVAIEQHVAVADVVPGVLLRGTLDLVDHVGGQDIIVDTKTTERAPSADVAHRSQQLTLYDLLRASQVGPSATSTVALDYLVYRAQSGTVTPARYVSTRGPDTRRVIVRRIAAAVATVQAGLFMPANPETDWWCSAKWCEFHATCPFAMRS